MKISEVDTKRVIRKVSCRLLPFLLLMYIVAFLDRANVSFAKEAFQADTGISDAAFAFGAGVFFLGYALLEIPGNLILHRIGAKIWMCRIMVTWGVASGAMAWVHNAQMFFIMRFILGAAEAGFFPGVILYLTYWFPEKHRSQSMGIFYFGAPLAFIFGGPLSGLLLGFDGIGNFQGWQWMFLLEGALASIVGIIAYFYLDDRPQNAKWLSVSDSHILVSEIKREQKTLIDRGSDTFKSLIKPGTVYLCIIYSLIQTGVYGMVFYLPGQVASLMGSKMDWKVGMISALPWICAIILTYLVCSWADHFQKHRLFAVISLILGCLGIAASVTIVTPLLIFVAICIGISGFIAVQPLFWTFPARMFSGNAAAAGIALINTIGALGGFLAPNLKQWSDSYFHSNSAGLYMISILTIINIFFVFNLKRFNFLSTSVP